MELRYIIPAIALAGLLSLLILHRDRIRLDGFGAEIVGLIFGEDTIYSSRYTETKYLTLKPGMSEKEIINILGKPLYDHKWKDTVLLSFSHSPTSTHYRLRRVLVSKGVAVEIMHEFYFD